MRFRCYPVFIGLICIGCSVAPDVPRNSQKGMESETTVAGSNPSDKARVDCRGKLVRIDEDFEQCVDNGFGLDFSVGTVAWFTILQPSKYAGREVGVILGGGEEMVLQLDIAVVGKLFSLGLPADFLEGKYGTIDFESVSLSTDY